MLECTSKYDYSNILRISLHIIAWCYMFRPYMSHHQGETQLQVTQTALVCPINCILCTSKKYKLKIQCLNTMFSLGLKSCDINKICNPICNQISTNFLNPKEQMRNSNICFFCNTTECLLTYLLTYLLHGAESFLSS